MGFPEEAIEIAMSQGCTSTAEAVDFICNRSASGRATTVAPLRLSKGVKSQFGQSSLASSSSPVLDLPPNPPSSSGEQSQTAEEEAVVKSRYKILQPSLSAQQEEAKKLAAELREEKRRKMEDRERVLREIERQKAAKAEHAQTTSTQPPVANPATPTDANVDASFQIKIRISLPTDWRLPENTELTVGRFDKSVATFGDLEDLVQTCLDAVTVLDHTTLSLHLPCVSLFTTDWPRRRLQGDSRSQLLTDLGIVENMGVIVVHDASICRAPSEREDPAEEVEPSAPAEPSSPPPSTPPPPQQEPTHPDPVEHEDEEAEDAENEVVDADYRSVTHTPQPPFRVSRTPGRPGSAAIWRSYRPQTAPPDNAPPAAAPSTGTLSLVRPLRKLCMDFLVDLVDRAVNGGPGSDIHAALERLASVPADSGVLGTTRTLHSLAFAWPEALGVAFMRELCSKGLFNVRSAFLLRNCVCCLDLDYYDLVTSDLVICLTRHWPGLVELRLKGLGAFQVSSYAIEQIGRLQNLQVLHLDGLDGVNNFTIPSIASLPKLRILRVASTKISDAGWRDLASRLDDDTGEAFVPAPLRYLNISAIEDFTDVGLAAVVRLFPQLKGLVIAKTEVTGIAPVLSQAPRLASLLRLDVSGCGRLLQIPPCLLPTSPVLARVELRGCDRIRVDRVLSQLGGQPIEKLDGFHCLPKLTREHLQCLAKKKFPLRELELSSLPTANLKLADLSQMLRDLEVPSLSRLLLPLTPLPVEGEEDLAFFMDALSGLTQLTYLDLGDQAAKLTPDQLYSLGQRLCLLTSLVARNLSAEQERRLLASLPQICKMRVTYTTDA
ncbi:unnamed protein product [Mesocestoides corti]|nr:unnamed protein product [Mesocestoides corti]